MKLLVMTQTVNENDAVLGFFIAWLAGLAKDTEQIKVICQNKDTFELPNNIAVFSLNKKKNGKIKRFFMLQRLLWQNIRSVDYVFCHMCPLYVILAFPLCFLLRKRIILWYVHRNVGFKLWLANKMSYKILTASESSVGLKNRKKIVVLGHGIDINLFKPTAPSQLSYFSKLNGVFNVLYVGRIAQIKNVETLIKAMEPLKNENIILNIVGDVGENKEEPYKQKILNLIAKKQLGNVYLKGKVPHQETLSFYQKSHLLVNMCPLGGLDKAVLEAMACELPVLVSNQGFTETMGKYSDILMFKYQDSADLAKKIIQIKQNPNPEIGKYLRKQIIKYHNLDNLIKNIIKQFNG